MSFPAESPKVGRFAGLACNREPFIEGPAFELVYSIVTAVDHTNPYAPNGGTIPVNGQPLPTDGFLVGGVVPTLTYPRFVDLDGPAVARFVQSLTAPYVGWWVDEETGVIHIDAVDHYASERDALGEARMRGEIAIWSVAGEREIRV